MSAGSRSTDPRSEAHRSLLACQKHGRFVNLEVQSVLVGTAMKDEDKRLYTALVYGCTERRVTLDWIISQYASRPPDKIDEATLEALRLGVYQLVWMDRIPAHAAVSESVALAHPRARGFANAVLRSFLRADKRYTLPQDNAIHALSVECGAPEALCAFFTERFGEDFTRAFLTASVNPLTTVRVNPLKTSTEAVVRFLADAEATISPLADDLVCFRGGAKLEEGLRQGLFLVQDAASRLCVKALAPQPGEFLIDVCAAPGGKTLSAALDMHNKGRILAFDLHENKLSLIRCSAETLGVTITETAARDAREPDPSLSGKADCVLCDAPCSGLGVIGKKPDIRYKPLDDVKALPAIQYAILCGAAQYVRPGGRLVYSTCTLNPDENESVVRRFLAEHGNFTAYALDLGAAGSSANGMRTLLPQTDGCDGFFIAAMTRKEGQV